MSTNITLEGAVKLLALRIYGRNSQSDPVPTDVSEVNILCPKCEKEHSSRRLTLNLNFEVQRFRCARCSFSGGSYKLISYYTGVPCEDVPAKLSSGDLGDIPLDYLADSKADMPVENVGNPIAPLKQRHDVYEALLGLLSLSESHRADLHRRGLSDEAIDRIGFKSFPKYMDPRIIPQKLINRGLDLRGVPGFYIGKTGEWAIVKLPDGGFLIPSRNGDGYIQGCQIRFDHPNDKLPKFGYLTSVNEKGGTKAGTWPSWAGEHLSSRPNNDPFDVILIEGPLKAYIVNEHTSINLIAVPGVNALKKIPAALQSMQKLGLRTVYIAYDMDAETNPQVAEQLNRLRDILSSLGIDNQTLFWDSDCKGLDDWIVSPHFKK